MEVKGGQVQWAAFFSRLQSSSPYAAYWSVREVADVPLPELYDGCHYERALPNDPLARNAGTASRGGPLWTVIDGPASGWHGEQPSAWHE
jgi:hypothetical protein